MEVLKESKIPGCFLLKPKIFMDERGTLVKPYHSESFKELGLENEYKEELIVTSIKGVIRGLHFQLPPVPQTKVVSCVNGRILDAVLDIRRGSPTYGEWDSFILDDQNNYVLYVPEGLAHGYAVYKENTIVCYRMSNIFAPKLDGGVRWDSADIDWGIKDPVLSEKDRSLIPFYQLNTSFIYE